MSLLASVRSESCADCRSAPALDFDLTMAFQPFVDVARGRVFGYEALVRGTGGQGAREILDRVNEANRYRFDQACRVKALELATRLGLEGILSINIAPSAIYRPETCIRATLAAADRVGFARDRLMFEVTEDEPVRDPVHLRNIFTKYRELGFRTAIDDFGAGYAGLTLLAEFQPDFIKLDMALTRAVDRDPVRQAIVGGIVATCKALSLDIIAEGVETREEAQQLMRQGVHLFQGYLFARPGFESLPTVSAELLADLRR